MLQELDLQTFVPGQPKNREPCSMTSNACVFSILPKNSGISFISHILVFHLWTVLHLILKGDVANFEVGTVASQITFKRRQFTKLLYSPQNKTSNTEI